MVASRTNPFNSAFASNYNLSLLFLVSLVFTPTGVWICFKVCTMQNLIIKLEDGQKKKT